MDGIWVAGIVLCIAGQPINSSNCTFERSAITFQELELCQAVIINRAETLHLRYDLDIMDVIRVDCYNWLPEVKKPNL